MHTPTLLLLILILATDIHCPATKSYLKYSPVSIHIIYTAGTWNMNQEHMFEWYSRIRHNLVMTHTVGPSAIKSEYRYIVHHMLGPGIWFQYFGTYS